MQNILDMKPSAHKSSRLKQRYKYEELKSRKFIWLISSCWLSLFTIIIGKAMFQEQNFIVI